MAVIALQQTDTTATCSYSKFNYSGSDNSGTNAAMDCREGGTQGTAGTTIIVGNAETDVAALLVVSNAIGQTTWASGTHTFRITVGTAAGNMTLTEVHVFRVNASCVHQEDLGSINLTTPEDMTSIGEKTISITGVSAATSPAATDKLAYVCVFTNAHAHADRTLVFTNASIITTPIEGVTIGELSGTVAITITPSGTLTATGTLAGAVPVTITPTGTLTGTGACIGSVPISLTPVGMIRGVGYVSGNVSISITPTATLTGTGSLSGAVSIGITPAGTLTGTGDLSGSVAITITPSGTLEDSTPPAGAGPTLVIDRPWQSQPKTVTQLDYSHPYKPVWAVIPGCSQ